MKKARARDILGVDTNASTEEIQRRYEELVKKNHPDQGGSAALFKQITTAHDVLTTPSNGNPQSKTTGNDRANSSSSTDSPDQDADHTYNASTVTDIEVDRLVDKSMGRLVTRNRLLKQEPGRTHPQTLRDAPLIDYLDAREIPHFTFVFREVTVDGSEFELEYNGFLVLSDRRIVAIWGRESGDEVYHIPYQDVTHIEFSEAGMLGVKNEFILDIDGSGTYRYLLQHTSMNESGVANDDELTAEFTEAEQFAKEMIYSSM